MSIHPEFADAIMSGTKTVEFRKRRPAADITKVYVYATAPKSQIIGWFDIDRIVEDTPSSIWKQFKTSGVIKYNPFRKYYSGSSKAFAIVVRQVHRLDDPLSLDEIVPRPAVPQSFIYLDERALAAAI